MFKHKLWRVEAALHIADMFDPRASDVLEKWLILVLPSIENVHSHLCARETLEQYLENYAAHYQLYDSVNLA